MLNYKDISQQMSIKLVTFSFSCSGCERLPERNAATYECLDVPGTFDNLDTRDPDQDYISYNGQYCQ